MPTQQEIDAARKAQEAADSAQTNAAPKIQDAIKSSLQDNTTLTPTASSFASASAPTPWQIAPPAQAPAQQAQPQPTQQAAPAGRALSPVQQAAKSPQASGLTQYAARKELQGNPPAGYVWNADKTNLVKIQTGQPGAIAPTAEAVPTATTPAQAAAPVSQATQATQAAAQTETARIAQMGLDASDAAEQYKKAIIKEQEAIKSASELSKGETYADAIKRTQQAADAQAQINLLTSKIKQNQSEANIRESKAQLDALKSNAAYLSGALGQPVSQVGVNAISDELNRAEMHYNDIVATSAAAQAAADIGDNESALQYTQKISDLKKQLNAEVSGSIQQSLVNLGKLDSIGDLNSPEAIVKARSEILDALKNNYEALTTNTAQKLKILNDAQQSEWQMKKDQRSADMDVSSKTGVLSNKFGEPILVGGKQVNIDKNKQVASKVDIPGGVVIAYTDGTTSTIKAYEPTQYGEIDLNKTATLGPTTGYVYDRSGNVAVGPDGKPIRYDITAQYDRVTTSDGNIIFSSKANPRESFTTDSSGRTIAVNGVPVGKRTEIRADDPSVYSNAKLQQPAGSEGGQCTKWARQVLESGGHEAWLNEGLARPEDDTVAFKASKTNTSVPSIGSAVAMNLGWANGHWGIVTAISEDGAEITVKSSNLHGDEKISTESFKTNNPAILGYYNPKLPKKATTSTGEDISVEEARKKFDDMNLVSRVTLATTGKTSGKDEREAANEKVRLGRVLWMSDAEIMNEAAGFKIKKDKADIGNKAIQALARIGVTPPDATYKMALAENINSGNIKAAAGNIETEAFQSKTGKDLDISEKDKDFIDIHKNVSTLLKKIDDQEKKIGVISGRWSDVKKKLGGDKELQDLQSNLTRTFAKLRKSFAGSAVTENEMKALEDYISGTTKEPIENLKAKVSSVLDGFEKEYNSARNTVRLPEITNDTIYDRSSLYFWDQTGKVVEWTNETETTNKSVYNIGGTEYNQDEIIKLMDDGVANKKTPIEIVKMAKEQGVPKEVVQAWLTKNNY